MNFQGDAFPRVDRNIARFSLSCYISELFPSIVQRKVYAKSGSSFYIGPNNEIQEINRLRAGISYLQFKLPRPFLVLQVFESGFLVLLNLYLYWHVLWY